MKIDLDVILILYGAIIGLITSLVTSLFQSWLSRGNEITIREG